MLVEPTTKGQLLIVRILEKRLDSSLALEFQSYIEKWLDEGHFRIILDLSAVDFIDSTILGVLVQWLKRVRREQKGDADIGGGDLVVCNIGFKIKSLFQLTRMDRVFGMFDDESEAVQAMAGDQV